METSFPTREQYEAALVIRHGRELQERLKRAKVAVCGLGGLGSNVSVCLARAGVGELHLIDFDKVDLSNIHRQQYFIDQLGIEKTQALCKNLQRINPYIKIRTDTVKVTQDNVAELLCDADVICEAFDKPEAKAMLVNEVMEKLPQKYLVAASGMAGIASANMIKTKKITNHFYLCGDGVSDIADGMGLISSRVMACAAHEAHMIIKIIAEKFEA